jgi:hypothetical protein
MRRMAISTRTSTHRRNTKPMDMRMRVSDRSPRGGCTGVPFVEKIDRGTEGCCQDRPWKADSFSFSGLHIYTPFSNTYHFLGALVSDTLQRVDRIHGRFSHIWCDMMFPVIDRDTSSILSPIITTFHVVQPAHSSFLTFSLDAARLF